MIHKGRVTLTNTVEIVICMPGLSSSHGQADWGYQTTTIDGRDQGERERCSSRIVIGQHEAASPARPHRQKSTGTSGPPSVRRKHIRHVMETVSDGIGLTQTGCT